MTFAQQQFFERIGTDSLAHRSGTDEHQPMDAGFNWLLMNNIQHLVDECGKYRVNFLHSTKESPVGMASPAHVYFWTHVLEKDKYPRYDIRAAFVNLGVADPVTARVSLVMPHMTSVAGYSGEFGVLGTWTATTPASGAEWTVDTTSGVISVSQAPIIQQPAPTFPGATPSGVHVLLKILVEWEGESVEGLSDPALIGLQVREYFT